MGQVLPVVALLLLAGCTGRVGPFPDAPVVLVSIDTLRADRLGFLGHVAARTPNLDRLAAEGVVFEDAFSHYPLTLPSHASLLTGLLPPRHGVRGNAGFQLADERTTLAERLSAAGWKAGAAVSSFVLARQTGIEQGFGYYDAALDSRAPETFNAAQRDGRRTLTSLLRWIRQRGGERYFAFLHLYEPHSPYEPPPPYSELPDAYDGEVSYADAIVGELREALEATGEFDRAIVVLVSDHGEDLGDHGEEEHGIFLYRSTLHVPLVVRLPGARLAGQRVSGPVGLADVAPTVVELLGLQVDGREFDGVSLVSAIASGHAPGHRIYSETLYPRYTLGWSELRSVSDAEWRYVRAPRPELYAASDSAETMDRIGERAATAAELDEWLSATVTALGDATIPVPAHLPADAAEKLSRLGYLTPSRAAFDEPAPPDPKDRVSVYPRLKRGTTAAREGRFEDAVPLFEGLLAENPRLASVREMLGGVLLRLQRHEEAIPVLTAGLELEPERRSLHLGLARAYLAAGRFEDAAAQATGASDGAPGAGAELIAGLLLERGDVGEAATWARRSLAENDRRVLATQWLGIAEKQAGRHAEALALFERADDLRPPGTVLPQLQLHIGECLAALGRLDEAEAAYRAELQVRPGAPAPRVGLARIYRVRRQPGRARAVIDQWLLAAPVMDAETFAVMIQMHRAVGDAESAEHWRKTAHGSYPKDPRFAPGAAADAAG